MNSRNVCSGKAAEDQIERDKGAKTKREKISIDQHEMTAAADSPVLVFRS
jgi:hypothetical protein